MIVIFEGPDGSGKDWLHSRFQKQTGYVHQGVTRMWLSDIVYAKLLNRPLWADWHERTKFINDFERFLILQGPLLVFTTAGTGILRERIESRGEKIEPKLEPQHQVIEYYKFIQQFRLEERGFLLEIDTTLNPSVEHCTERILGKIEKRRKHYARR